MTPADEQNARIAAKLGMAPQEVGRRVSSLSDAIETAVLRAKFCDRIQQILDENVKKLRTVKPEELLKVQGKVEGLEQAIMQINDKLL